MKVNSQIRAQLRSILLTVPGLPTQKWQGKTFEPSPLLPYVRERLEPISGETVTLGRTGMTQENMTYVIDVFWPVSGFIHEAEDMADAIRTVFYTGLVIAVPTTDKINGGILRQETRPMIDGATFNQFPVRVSLYIRRPLAMA